MDEARRERQRYLWNTCFHFGDWLIPSLVAGGKSPIEAAAATAEVVACSFYAYSTQLMARVAEVLGHTEDQRALRPS